MYPTSEEAHRPGPNIPADWKERYLALVRETGNLVRNARRAGVTYRTVQRYRDNDPDFAESILEAVEEAADKFEDDMIAQAEKSENPVGYIVRLKALRAAKYIERHAILNLSVDASGCDPDTVRALAFEMVRALTPASLNGVPNALTSGNAPELVRIESTNG